MLGARARFPPGFGAMYVRMNQRLNQPRVISSTGLCWRPSRAAEIAGKRISFPIRRCSRHWPTLHASPLGCQLNWARLSPVATDSARRSATSNSEMRRNDHLGQPESAFVDTCQDISTASLTFEPRFTIRVSERVTRKREVDLGIIAAGRPTSRWATPSPGFFVRLSSWGRSGPSGISHHSALYVTLPVTTRSAASFR